MNDQPGARPAVSGAVAVVLAAVAVTCASQGTFSHAAPEPVQSAPVPSAKTAPAVAAPSAASPATANIDPLPSAPLARFYAALSDLEAKRRTSSVRLAWFGDSHTFADLYVHEVRKALGARFGFGGPGFLCGATQNYSRAAARVRITGEFKRTPKSPAKIVLEDDGVFGLGGMRYVPKKRATVQVELGPKTYDGKVRWEFLSRSRTPGAGFTIRSGSQRTATRAAGGAIQHTVLDQAEPTLEFTSRGTPEWFGLYAEGTTPGVVIDNFGINGARVATPLAWDEKSFVEQLRARAPELVVFAYGTNEAVSELKAERLAQHFRSLRARVRAAAPQADCLILGPPDLFRDGASWPRVAEFDQLERLVASELGCGYLSQLQLMGGAGAFASWMEAEPPLGSADGIHLTVEGYRKIGAAIAEQLLAAYERFRTGTFKALARDTTRNHP